MKAHSSFKDFENDLLEIDELQTYLGGVENGNDIIVGVALAASLELIVGTESTNPTSIS